MKQVPGSKSEKAIQEETALLQQWLTANDAFLRLRGRMSGRTPVEFLMDLGGWDNLPSACRRIWKNFHSDWQVVGGMLAKLRRDNMIFAYQEIVKALQADDYIVCGESVAFDKTAPFTVLMVYPEITLKIIRLYRSCEIGANGYYEFNNYCEGKISAGAEFREVFKRLPSLRYYFKEQQNIKLALASSYFTDIVLPIIKPTIKMVRRGKINIVHSNSELFQLPFVADAIMPHWNEIYEPYISNGLAYLIPGKQNKVLSAFDRNEKRIATWQFHLPAIYAQDRKTFSLGLHPEGEHTLWQKIRPAYCSRGISAGLGAVMNFGDEYQNKNIGDFRKRVWVETYR